MKENDKVRRPITKKPIGIKMIQQLNRPQPIKRIEKVELQKAIGGRSSTQDVQAP